MARRFTSLEIDNTQQTTDYNTQIQGEMPKDAEYFLKEANTHFFRMEYEPALKDYSRVTGLDSGAIDAWKGQIMCLLEMEEYKEAELWYGKAVEIIGENQDILALRALIAARTGDFDKACAFSDASLEATGKSPLPFVARGELFMYSNRNADYCFNQACESTPGDWQTIVLIANSCIFKATTKSIMLGMKYLQPFIDKHPQIPELYIPLGRMQMFLGKNNLAYQAFDQAIGLCPDITSLKALREQTKKRKGFFAWLLGK